MTLRRTMVYQIAATIAGLLVVVTASLWGITGLHHEFGTAIAGYEELRRLYDASSHVATARTLVQLSPHAEAPALEQIRQAMEKFDAMAETSRDEEVLSSRRRAAFRQAIRTGLLKAQTELRLVAANRAKYDPQVQAAPLTGVLEEVSRLVAEIRNAIERRQEAASRKQRTTLAIVAGLSVLIIVGAVIIGVGQYRSVMRPLKNLGDGVRRLAAGNLQERISPAGHAEFAELATDFNRMAAELDGLYRDLENKVAEKSRELVRSERLASVGYLAAGVAHEINNPIGIIAGYAELSLGQLRSAAGESPALAEARKALELICEEAFRCKQIVGKLLSLARPGEEARRPVALDDIARNVVSIVSGLKDYRHVPVRLEIQRDADLTVVASEGEMKQVVLNLTLNALESGEGGVPQVVIRVGRRDGTVELSVEDNGRGMAPEVLERVFEPFFTARRGSQRPGTGLGLSITHAIVESHGGRIQAHSDGPGRGSRFVVSLPAHGQSAGKTR